MRPRVRIKVWPVLIPVVVLLAGYLLLKLTRPRPLAPVIPTPTPVPPTSTSARVLATPVPAAPVPGASTHTITGDWSGTLRQPGAPISAYTFSMSRTEQATGAVFGTAPAEVPNLAQYYVVETITGQVSGAAFSFQRGSILESGPPGRGWCIDSVQLTFSPDGTILTVPGKAEAVGPARPRPPGSQLLRVLGRAVSGDG